MGYYIRRDGSYYEGDRAYIGDISVPKRPSPNHTWNGEAWVENVTPFKRDVYQLILDEVSRTRERYIDVASNQAASYMEKVKDAEKYKALLYPDPIPIEFPYVEAEAAARAVSGQVAADYILDRYMLLRKKDANVELVRRRSYENLLTATTLNQIRLVYTNALRDLSLV